MRLRNTLLTAAMVLAPLSAHAEADWFASLYTNEGIELRADERIFTLYALLNAAGYDEAPVVRQYPVPARDMSPARLRIRDAVRLDPSQSARVSSYFDAHPMNAQSYARYALNLGGPGGFARPANAPADLKGAEALLADVYGHNKIGELFAQTQDEYRSALKGYHGAIDAPVTSVRKLLKVNEDSAPRVVLVVNLLDARGKSFSQKVNDELYVVVGPARDPDLFAVTREVARAALEPVVMAKAASARNLNDALMAARETGADADSPGAYATEVLARAFAAKAMKLSEPEVEAQARGGYAPVRDVMKAIEGFQKNDKQGLEPFVADALAAMGKESGGGKRKGK